MFFSVPTSRTLLAGAALLFLLSPLGAQQLSVTVSPDPAPVGSVITVTATDASGLGLYTPFGCLVTSVVAGTPGGALVKIYPCTFLGVSIPACGSGFQRTSTWDTAQPIMGGGLAQPGLYYVEIQTSIGPFGAISTEWHPVTLTAPGSTAPLLSAVNAPTWGSAFQLALSAPTHPFDLYAVALSASTNSGVTVAPGVFFSLDVDAVFQLTFPTPDPNLFVNFQGGIDYLGNAPTIAINLPPLALGCLPLRAQAATVSSAGVISLSNPLHFTIQ